MEDLKPILRDYKFIKDRHGQEEEAKEMVELFSPFPRSVDFADDLAKLVIVRSLEYADFQESLTKSIGIETKISEEQRVAWGLMVAISAEIRQIRFSDRKKIEEEIEKGRAELERRLSSPGSIAEFMLEFSAQLDESGQNAEANILRDAYTVLKEDF